MTEPDAAALAELTADLIADPDGAAEFGDAVADEDDDGVDELPAAGVLLLAQAAKPASSIATAAADVTAANTFFVPIVVLTSAHTLVPAADAATS